EVGLGPLQQRQELIAFLGANAEHFQIVEDRRGSVIGGRRVLGRVACRGATVGGVRVWRIRFSHGFISSAILQSKGVADSENRGAVVLESGEESLFTLAVPAGPLGTSCSSVRAGRGCKSPGAFPGSSCVAGTPGFGRIRPIRGTILPASGSGFGGFPRRSAPADLRDVRSANGACPGSESVPLRRFESRA